MPSLGLLVVYSLLIAAASLAGGWIPQRLRMTHRHMQFLVSFVGGLMLGVAVLHLLPHGAAAVSSFDIAVRWMLGGVVLMFFLLRVFHFHHHPGEEELSLLSGEGNTLSTSLPSGANPALLTLPVISQESKCSHQHADGHNHGHVHPLPAGALSWLGVFIGLALHTLIDGMALAASVQVESTLHHDHASTPMLAGLATFLAVLLHKPLDAMSITSLMKAGGWSKQASATANLGFAIVCPLGAALFYLGVLRSEMDAAAVIGRALALSAGVFLCIALSDLLPEIEFHTHDRFALSALLLGGITAAAGIGLLEPHGAHAEHGGHPTHNNNTTSHDDHEHDESPHTHLDSNDKDHAR